VPAGARHAARRVGHEVSRPHLVERAREQLAQLPVGGRRPGAAAGHLGEPIEEPVRLAADRVNDDAAAARRVEDRLFREPARRVVAVGEDQHQRPRAIVRPQRQRELQRVAQRRRAARTNCSQRATQRLLVGGHPDGDLDVVREGDERRAIVRRQRVDDASAGLLEMGESLAEDARAGVEEQGDAQRDPVQGYAVDVLRNTIVGEHEVARRQPWDWQAAARHRHVELDDLDAAAERRRRLLRDHCGRDRRDQRERADHRPRASARNQFNDA